MKIKKKLFYLFIFIFFLTFITVGCSHKKDIKRNIVQLKKPAKVLILPFKKISPDLKRDFKCNIAKDSIVCSYSEEQFKLIGRQLAEKFYFAVQEKRNDYKLVSIDDVENVFQMPIDKISLNEIADRFNLDYFIEGYVYKFIERKGSTKSVKEPATVHFVVGIRNAITGEILWKTEYYEKQQDLSSNLLNVIAFFKRKARWLTALELAEIGINKIIDELP